MARSLTYRNPDIPCRRCHGPRGAIYTTSIYCERCRAEIARERATAARTHRDACGPARDAVRMKLKRWGLRPAGSCQVCGWATVARVELHPIEPGRAGRWLFWLVHRHCLPAAAKVPPIDLLRLDVDNPGPFLVHVATPSADSANPSVRPTSSTSSVELA